MKRIYLTLALVLLAAMLCAEPTVTNVNASQRTDGSQKVDIYYDLSNSVGGPMTVWLMGSNDNGSSWNMPCSTVSGAIGRNVYAGTNKHIVWNAAVDFPNTSCANFKFRVIAFGGDIPPIPEEFVYINGGTFNMGGRAVSLSSYMIGTFEITRVSGRRLWAPIPPQAMELAITLSICILVRNSNTAICAVWQKGSPPVTQSAAAPILIIGERYQPPEILPGMLLSATGMPTVTDCLPKRNGNTLPARPPIIQITSTPALTISVP